MQKLPFLRKFLPLFGLAAFLPFLLFFVVNSPNLRFTSQANPSREIHLWFEPATVIAKPGEPAQVTVMAEVPDERVSVFSLQAQLRSADNLAITPVTVAHQQPFTGRIEVGTVEIRSFRTGKFRVTIPAELVTTNESSVDVRASDLELIIEK